MRFDTPVYFQRIESEYDQTTGNYVDTVAFEECCRASVTNTGTENLKLIYGTIKQNALTVRLQTHYTKPFDFVKIGGKQYRVDFARELRRMHVLVVSEVQGNGKNQN